ncbi:hypothetical protein ACOTF3_04430 [Achromobacter xylosoxidans]
MEIDDHGKERRNALLVSAAICAAAFLQLKMPSFLAEYIKFEVSPEHAYRVWLLAAALTFYVLMRYHFSDSRTQALEASNLKFSKTLDRYLSVSKNKALSSNIAAFEDWASAVKKVDDTYYGRPPQHIGYLDFEPYNCSIHFREVFITWRLRPSTLQRHPELAQGFPTRSLTSFPVSIPQSIILSLWEFAYRVFYSKTAWEVNTVYATSFLAIASSIIRVFELRGPIFL